MLLQHTWYFLFRLKPTEERTTHTHTRYYTMGRYDSLLTISFWKYSYIRTDSFFLVRFSEKEKKKNLVLCPRKINFQNFVGCLSQT